MVVKSDQFVIIHTFLSISLYNINLILELLMADSTTRVIINCDTNKVDLY